MSHIHGHPNTGYQPRTTPAERRAFFDLQRQMTEIREQSDALALTMFDLASYRAETAGVTAATGMDFNFVRVCRRRIVTSGTRYHVSIFGFIRNNTGGALAAGSDLFTVPEGYRPGLNSLVHFIENNNAAAGIVSVSTAGLAEAQAGATGVGVGESLVLTGSWET